MDWVTAEFRSVVGTGIAPHGANPFDVGHELEIAKLKAERDSLAEKVVRLEDGGGGRPHSAPPAFAGEDDYKARIADLEQAVIDAKAGKKVAVKLSKAWDAEEWAINDRGWRKPFPTSEALLEALRKQYAKESHMDVEDAEKKFKGESTKFGMGTGESLGDWDDPKDIKDNITLEGVSDWNTLEGVKEIMRDAGIPIIGEDAVPPAPVGVEPPAKPYAPPGRPPMPAGLGAALRGEKPKGVVPPGRPPMGGMFAELKKKRPKAT